jgi:hypothetical protein
MKKTFKALILFTLAILSFGFVYAQDGGVSGDDVFSMLVSIIPAKYQAMVLTAVTGLYMLEQVLAASTKIKANSTFQLIAGWIVSTIKAVKVKFQK